MSQIFDALQRSDSERAGNAAESSLRATDVLQRAENLASTKWADSARTAQIDAAEIPEIARAIDPQRLRRPIKTDGALPAAEPITVNGHLDILSQFKTLQPALSHNSRLISYTEKDSPAAEAFRLLGVRLRDLRRTRPLQKVLITSTIPQEGKSMVAANLARTLAGAAQQRILLLEGDVRRPALTQTLGLHGNPGLCEWLQGERSLMTCIYRLEGLDFWVMPAGVAPANPLELLQSAKLSSLLDQLSEWFETILIDSPPVLPMADTSVWMRQADGVLLVTRQGKTEKRQLKRGLEAVDHQKLIGAVLNGSSNMPHSDYYYRVNTNPQ
jgi:capsular exopolysaccharide synthesis family protein